MTTKIEWTDETWNPVTGCTKVSDGCKHCYAERTWKRLAGNPHSEYFKRPFTDVKCHPGRLDQPLRRTKPQRIFVNSMSDLFHEDVPFEFIASVFAVMGVTTRHTYQILTKRPERMLKFFEWVHEDCAPGDFDADDKIYNYWPKDVPWKGYDNCGPRYPYENVWLGVSVENQPTADERIQELLRCPAAVHWLSIEPMLGPVILQGDGEYLDRDRLRSRMYLRGTTGDRRIDWVVLGGESGPKARPMHPDWARSVRDQCQTAGVPFFFKQWGEWAPVDLDTARGITDWMIVDKHGDIDIPDDRTPREDIGEVAMRRTGKKKAGNTLDGHTWEEYPNA